MFFPSSDTLKATRHVPLPFGAILQQVAVMQLSSSLEGGSLGVAGARSECVMPVVQLCGCLLTAVDTL
jgi:hypothetical protein